MTSHPTTSTPGSHTAAAPADPVSDTVRVPRYLGLLALAHLAGKEGAVAVDSSDRHLYFLVEHATARWDLPHTMILNTEDFALPPAEAETPPGPYWLTPLRRGRRHTDAAALYAALQHALALPAPAGNPDRTEVLAKAPAACRRTDTTEPRDRPPLSSRGKMAMKFPATPASVRRARDRTGRALRIWKIPRALADTVAVVSELMTNAVVHTAGAQAELVLTHGDGLLLVEVRDDSACPPVLVRRAGDGEGGRGLQLVHALASDWGWRPLGEGRKTVWALLAVRRAELTVSESERPRTGRQRAGEHS